MSRIQSFWTHCERTSLGLLKEKLLSSTSESVYLLNYPLISYSEPRFILKVFEEDVRCSCR